MVKLEERKIETEAKPIEVLALPQKAYIPLSQHLGKICQADVVIGDSVVLGQKIAHTQAQIYAPIHSSISGRVSAVRDWPHPILGRCKAILIESDGLDSSQFVVQSS